MKTYKPTDKLTFGQYKGEDMRFVYTFDPPYVEWMILNLDHFLIDPTDYENLHTSPIDMNEMTQRLGIVTVGVQGVIRNLSLREFLKEFMTELYENNYANIPEPPMLYTFSNKALSALELKTQKDIPTNDWL
jgi:hypothetical protein